MKPPPPPPFTNMVQDSCQRYISSYTLAKSIMCTALGIYLHSLDRCIYCIPVCVFMTSTLGIMPPIWVYTFASRIRVGGMVHSISTIIIACTSQEMYKLYRASGAEPLTWCGMPYYTHEDPNGLDVDPLLGMYPSHLVSCIQNHTISSPKLGSRYHCYGSCAAVICTGLDYCMYWTGIYI